MELSNNGDPFIDLYPINWAEDVPAARLIPPTTSSAWQVSAAQPYFELDYQILTPSGAPSGYWLWTHFDDPFFGSNSGTCSITTTDSSGPHPLNAPAAPYTCFWTNVGGSNPHPTLHVQAATLVTDPAEALQLAQNNCRTGAPHCIFSDVTFGASVGNSAPVGAVYVNESQQEGTHSIDWSKTVEESNTITTSVQVSATLNKLIQVQITVGYSHEWSTSTTFGETDSIDVPAGYAGWFTFIPGLQTASGGFFVTDRSNDTFLTKRANATFTTSDGRGAVIPHTCKLVPGTDPNPPQGCQTAVTNGAPILVSGTPSR